MKSIAIYDLETTGLNPTTDRVVEVGIVRFSVEHASTLECWSGLIQGDGNAAHAINAIPPATLTNASPAAGVWRRTASLFDQVDAVLAHNAAFDHSFTPSEVRTLKPWLCSKNDLEWPRASNSSSLVNVALAHGVGVSSAHRALTDCLLLARLLERVSELGIDLSAFLARGLIPKKTYRALVSYEQREKAKSAGFSFDGATKRWLRTMSPDAAAALPFGVEEVAPR